MDLSIPKLEKSKIVFYDGGGSYPDFQDDLIENRFSKSIFTRVLIGEDLIKSFPNGAKEIHDIRIFEGKRYSHNGMIIQILPEYRGQVIREVSYAGDPKDVEGLKIIEFHGIDETGNLVVKMSNESGMSFIGSMWPQFTTLSVEKFPPGKEKDLEKILDIKNNFIMSMDPIEDIRKMIPPMEIN